MKKIKLFIAAFIFVAMSALVFVPVGSVAAAGALDGVCTGAEDNALCDPAVKDKEASGFVGKLVNALLFIVGALSVIMIIVGGILYATSQGDSGSVTKAKNTILYSVVGLVVSFLAYAIVNWVLQLF